VWFWVPSADVISLTTGKYPGLNTQGYDERDKREPPTCEKAHETVLSGGYLEATSPCLHFFLSLLVTTLQLRCRQTRLITVTYSYSRHFCTGMLQGRKVPHSAKSERMSVNSLRCTVGCRQMGKGVRMGCQWQDQCPHL
jgi:hypothetical protein